MVAAIAGHMPVDPAGGECVVSPGSGDGPAAVVAGDEAEGDQALQVDSRTAMRPPQLVALDAAVAQLAVVPRVSHANVRSTMGRQRQ